MGYGGGGGGGGGAGGGGAGGSGGYGSGSGTGSGGYADDSREYPSLNKPPAGSIRFNTDSSKMEIYNGDKWWNMDSTSPTEQTGGTRGFIAGGYTNAPVAAYGDISYFNVATTGNALDFGDTIATGGRTASGSSRTRGITFYANAPEKNTIE